MRFLSIFVSGICLLGCAHGLAPSQRELASENSAQLSALDACRKDLPGAAESVCEKVGPGYVDCREDYANNSPLLCLHAKAGFADCRKDYLNLSVATCLEADAQYQACREKNTATECLGMNVSAR